MTGKLTCDSTKPSKVSAATLAYEGSRSLTLSGSSAQLSSSRRLVTPRLLERFRLVQRQLKRDSGRGAVAVTFQVRRAESDARGSRRDRKSVVT